MKIAFVTGATGFLGGHFVLQAVQSYDHFYLMIRGENREEKLIHSLKVIADSYSVPLDIDVLIKKTTIVQGDLSGEFCNLNVDEIVDATENHNLDVWHFAAALNFEASAQDTVDEFNVGGTQELLHVVKLSKAARFFYVSTAYSCGDVEGLVKEELHSLDREFSNVYERSKCEAEHKVVEYCESNKIDWVIFRPSIVIGNSETYVSAGTTIGMYHFIKQISSLAGLIKRTECDVRLWGDPDAVINVVPVNLVVANMLKFKEDNALGIFHLTSYVAPTYNFMIGRVLEYNSLDNMKVELFSTEESSPVERMVTNKIKRYSSYLHRTLIFENNINIVVDKESATHFIREGLKEIYSSEAQETFSSVPIEVDGELIQTYYTGDPSKPAVFIVNAFSMSVEIVSRLAKSLSKKFFVMTWEIKNYSNTQEAHVPLSQHVNVLKAIAENWSVKKFHMVAWCSGVYVALKASETLKEQVDKIILLNGSYYPLGLGGTPFEINLINSVPKVVINDKYAKLLHSSLFLKKQEALDAEQKRLYDTSTEMLSEVNTSLAHLIYEPYETWEGLQNHCRLINGYCNGVFAKEEVFPVSQEVLLMAGHNDSIVRADAGEKATQLFDKGEYLNMIGEDHFMLFYSLSCMMKIQKFLLREREKNE
jgi:nucleoside-diphosphate-sugar epimerase/pimeloyl-ACP methyl ester carboxylesterase